MSAKDGILHAMKWTVKDEFNHKMEISNAVDGCVIFYPHNDMVQITYEDLEKLIENLKKPNSNYIRKNSREEKLATYRSVPGQAEYESVDDYIRKNSREEKTEKVDVKGWTYTDENGTRDYIQEELGKRLAVAEKPKEYSAEELEVTCQEFADNYHGTYNPEEKTIRIPIDEIIDDCANRVEQFNIPFQYISKDLKDYVYIIQL